MSKIHNESRKAALAVAMAAGRSVPDWAEANGVPERTARTWSNAPEVVAQVEAIRRQVVDQTVGQLCEHATVAVQEIVRLIKEAKSESVRLQAARAVLAELMAVSGFAALNGRMAELERMVREGVQPPVPGPRPDPSDRPAPAPTHDPSMEETRPCQA